jgi:hypothetical protein
MKSRSVLESTLLWLSILLGLFVMLTVFSDLLYNGIRIYFCTDTLYLPALYKDLFTDHNGLRGWHLNPSPNFFPDMAVYFLFMLMTGNFIVSSFLYSVVQYVVILLVMKSLYRTLFPGGSGLFLSISILLMNLFFLVSLYSKDYMFTFYLMSNSYHTGAFLMGLVCLSLTLRYVIKPSGTRIFLLFILGTLSVVSDRLFIILFIAPVLILLFIIVQKDQLKHTRRLIPAILGSLASGLCLFWLLNHNWYIFIDRANSMMNMKNILPSLLLLSKQLWEYMSEPGFRGLIVWLSLASFVISILLFRKAGKNREINPVISIYLLFSVLYTVIVLLAPVFNGNYTGYDTFRYNIYVLYLSLFNYGIFLSMLLAEKIMLKGNKRLTIAANALLFASVLLLTVPRFSSPGLRGFFNYYPVMVQDADEAATRDSLEYGVANYWDAKVVTMFSKKGVRVYPVYDDLFPYDHVSNWNWYTDPKASYNFIIMNHIADPTAYIRRLGDPGRPLPGRDAQIVKVKPFIYDPATTQPVLKAK